MGWILVIILLVLCFGAFPHFNYNSSWGYGPSGILGFILLIVIIFWALGRL